jgi:tetratricopeptide (TPR) repeat protein
LIFISSLVPCALGIVVDTSQKEFLLVLAYLYIRYCKYDEALIIYRGLFEFFEDDREILLGLIFALYVTGRAQEALTYVERLDGVDLAHGKKKLFFLLKSHVSWGLGRDREARESLIHYLGLEEGDMRAQEAYSKAGGGI